LQDIKDDKADEDAIDKLKSETAFNLGQSGKLLPAGASDLEKYAYEKGKSGAAYDEVQRKIADAKAVRDAKITALSNALAEGTDTEGLMGAFEDILKEATPTEPLTDVAKIEAKGAVPGSTNINDQEFDVNTGRPKVPDVVPTTTPEVTASVLPASSLNSMLVTGNYDKLNGIPTTDPSYQKIAAKIEPINLSYKNRSGMNDQWSQAPAEGEWTKITTPAGQEIIAKVTYKGFKDSPGTSDQAYIQFKGTDGKFYSAYGSAGIRDGKNGSNLFK
jgi:hypothetical protein